MPRAGRAPRARVLPDPPFRGSQPLPRAARPAGGFSAGEPPAPPRPAPPPPGPSGGDCGQAGRGTGRRGEGPGDGVGRARGGGREEAGPAAQPRPGPVACHWSARPAQGLSSAAPPQPFRRIRGRKRGGSSPRLPSTFFLSSWGGRREGEADLQTPRRPQPSSERLVTRGPAAPFGPRYLSPSFAPGGPTRAASPRARASARPPAHAVRLGCALGAPRPATFSPAPGGLR